MAISRLGNVFLQDSAPWVALKTDRTAAGTIIAVAANLVRLLSVILEPFMPGFSDKICYQLNMDHGNIPDEWTYVPRRAWGARSRVCVCVENGTNRRWCRKSASCPDAPAQFSCPRRFDVPANHHVRKPQPLFRPIQAEEVAAWRARFGGSEEAKAAAGAAPSPAAPAATAGAAAGAAPKKGKPWVKGEKKKQKQKPPAVLRLELRVGRILSVTEHEEADKLYVETVDVGEEEPRVIVSGLRVRVRMRTHNTQTLRWASAALDPAATDSRWLQAHYRKEDLEGRLVPVLCNLKPRAFLGVASHGMLLCANNDDRSKIEVRTRRAGEGGAP